MSGTRGVDAVAVVTAVIRVAVLAGGGAVACYDFADRSTVTAARVKPPTAKTAVSGGFPGRLEIAAETRPYLAGWSLRPSGGYHGVPHVIRSSPVRPTLPATTTVGAHIAKS